MSKKLTAKQSLFVKEYLIDLNATQAAIRCGYSERTARSQGQRLLTNVDIQQAIQKQMDIRAEKIEITADRVLEEIARIAFLDIRKAFDEDGNLLSITEMPEDIARAIGGMDVSIYREKGEDGGIETTKKIKLIDKKGALELLGKHLKLFIERVEHTGKDGGPIETTEIPQEELARRIAFTLTQEVKVH